MTDHISATGRVATAPRRIEVGDSGSFVSFRMATNSSRYDEKAGRWVDLGTNWYSVKAWRGLGDNAMDSLKVGEQIVVRGRLEQRTWRDDAGAERLDVTITADALGHDLRRGTTVLSPTSTSSGGSSGDAPNGETADGRRGGEAQPVTAGWASPGTDEELPF
ncbi:single-stranded DNA-binding protein [Herbiconiux sp. L3-i23]|uniref:single-stranded DNA-binding protein n=1 Tax=Herbiconiux sp. L3-i23 TaxID=2905871 RepID=UPI0020663F3C|nr:single-stranded DNA-binding protein [Herbiconiux sp. L3-i23]BDI23234.1 hypothetical protein L3i23_20100 [Herbiconiux sp. L3-i23]